MRLRTHRIPGLVLSDHQFTVPLDHDRPGGEQITIFAREVVAPDKEGAGLPWLVFFQGGPGSESPRPREKSGWLKRALEDYRVLLLDQRGTGLSTPATHQTLARLGSPEAQADYLRHFRADSIVRDAEWIRRDLVGKDGRWSVLGQSYGGFCVTHYLSAAPGGLREAFITGGLPPLERPADDVYRATYRQLTAKNERYYERYPEDVEQARRIADHIDRHNVRLADGSRLSVRRFQQFGLFFGASDGFEQVHYLLEEAFVPGASGDELGYKFLRSLDQTFHFETNPIFIVLHEAIYCQGSASRWAAQRLRAEYPAFEPAPNEPLYFTGEMIYPWMLEEYPRLQPLREAAEILANYDGWPHLYEIDRLQANQVPCAAAVYFNDMYVEREYSLETADKINGIRVWITNEYEHNGLRADGEAVLGRLVKMVRGEL